MWNAMKTKSLVAALVITATTHGSLLWKMNAIATESASGMSQTSVNSQPTGSTASSPGVRYVTLEPVFVVGKCQPFMPDEMTAQADTSSSATQGECLNTRANPVTVNGQKDGATRYC